MNKLLSSSAAALALVATASAAAAANTFTSDPAQTTASSVALTGVEADQAGTIQVYADDGAMGFGPNLGSARIDAGVTGDVAIALREPYEGDVVVVMMDPDHWVAKATTRPSPTEADLTGLAPAASGSGPVLARGLARAAEVCVVTSSDGQVVHDSSGNPVTSSSC